MNAGCLSLTSFMFGLDKGEVTKNEFDTPQCKNVCFVLCTPVPTPCGRPWDRLILGPPSGWENKKSTCGCKEAHLDLMLIGNMTNVEIGVKKIPDLLAFPFESLTPPYKIHVTSHFNNKVDGCKPEEHAVHFLCGY